MKDLLGRIVRKLENRPAKAKRRLALLEEKEKIGKPLHATITAATLERKRLRDILDGVPIIRAEKELHRVLGPIDAEIASLTKELQENPPSAIASFLEESSRMENRIRVELHAKPVIHAVNSVGDWAEQTFVDRESAQACLEALHQRKVQANDLAKMDLSDEELTARIAALEKMPLPEVRTKKLWRENAPFAEIQETLIA
jgi:hypothetical protein